ncbi:RbtT/DalT/CsbX family MFS transporter [Microlunatus soli]|uniref:Major Facilitator Superfamily protein n=1 Tax=Microlunatus soli TaxID=630515 RepID=A0A1H1SAR0_9ACTN|nr:RbtT/DalT/CsbX family MFS transporter [Microlunatus soli]SDS45042.1 Major Facilitator Superfamily protein [Microlunatus soli]
MTSPTPTTVNESAGADYRGFLGRLGIPHVLRWGFLGVLIFMTGHGVESNFISPLIATELGNGTDNIGAASTIIAMYGISVIIGSYLSGALSDLFGPRKIMMLGFAIWVVFEALFVVSLAVLHSEPLSLITYFLRGFGYPLFAFSFLVWVNAVADVKRNGAAVGWFYVMFTGGLPTLGSLYALIFIPIFGGGNTGEIGAMISGSGLVVLGFMIVMIGVQERTGRRRLAPADESANRVVLSGVRLAASNPKIFMGFLVRLINTSPEFGMFVIMPAVIATQLGYGQSRWLAMTVCVYAGNILLNAVFGNIGDKFGWVRTVRWFGVFGSAAGLLLWWYVPNLLPHSDVSFVLSVIAGVLFGIMLAGFVPMGAIMPNLTPDHKGAAMAMYTTAAGGAAFSGAGVVKLVQLFTDSNAAVVWAFVGLYAVAFVLVGFLKVPQDEKGARQH